MTPDFSQLSQSRREEIERYVNRLTDDQADRLAVMDPADAADKIFPEAEGLGFFWWIIEAAYAVYVAKQAKEKKAKAKKKADEVKKKAAAAIAKEKEKLTAIKKSLDELELLQKQQSIFAPLGGAGSSGAGLVWLIGLVAITGGISYLITRRKRRRPK